MNQLKNVIKGKNISILGDSVSTFEGVSYVQGPWYGAINTTLQRSETWWQQVIDAYELNLCVNNSMGGSGVYSACDSNETTLNSGYNRAGNLRLPTSSPDIIAVFMGFNDHDDAMPLGAGSLSDTKSRLETLITKAENRFVYSEPQTFADAYYIMMHKIVNDNKNADLFAFALYSERGHATFNSIIIEMANEFGATLVDLYDTPLKNYTTDFTLVDAPDSVHPNAQGMAIIAKTFIKALERKYLNK